MIESAITPTNEPVPQVSRWRRIIGFPLVSLLLGLLAFGVMAAILGVAAYAYGKATGVERIQDIPTWFGSYLKPLAVALGSIVVLKLVLRRLGMEPRDDLPFDGRSRDGLTGIALAAVLMSAIVGIAAALGGYRISGWGGSGSLVWLLLAAGVKAAVSEEILFRGVVFRFLEEFAGSWFALIAAAAVFGLIHARNPNATALTTLAIAVQAGLLLSGAYMLTRNLWLAIGLHGGWNFTQGYIWDVPVSGIAVDGMLDAHPAGPSLISGGAFGLEGSIIATVLVSAVGIAMVVAAVRRGHVVQPWWVRRRRGLALPASSGPLARRRAP